MRSFSVMDFPTADLDEAIEMRGRYVAILGGTVEIDVRPIELDDTAA